MAEKRLQHVTPAEAGVYKTLNFLDPRLPGCVIIQKKHLICARHAGPGSSPG